MSRTCILSIDQGTTSSRAILFEKDGTAAFTAQREFRQIFPQPGWVEHDPAELWDTTVAVCREAVAHAQKHELLIATAGITNQRETTLLWNRSTGEPIGNAIVWQDRRTAQFCAQLKASGYEPTFTAKTGLLLDPYFSGTKIRWMLDNIDGAREKAEQGELAFGTVDSYLLWRLTDGKVHATDATNASRTLIYNIHSGEWDEELLRILDIPTSLLPVVRDSAYSYGEVSNKHFGSGITINGIGGDQQAATFGQACFEPGTIKSTYGTGCFVLLNTGAEALTSSSKLLTTIGYRLNGETSYATEGSIFVAGAAVQWLRDGLKVISSAQETEQISASLTDNAGVYLVPAFTGLGAPYWDPDARGAMFGLTRDTAVEHIVRATLESVAYQTYDLFKAMGDDGVTPTRVRVDGGMVSNNWLCQFLADILNIPVERPVQTETTALGAAYLAGLQAGVYNDFDDLKSNWRLDREFKPQLKAAERDRLLAAWQRAVASVQHQHQT